MDQEDQTHPKDLVYAVNRQISLGGGRMVFRIRQISDTHQDAEGFNKDLFREFVRVQSSDKDSVWIHTGDLPDSDRPTTRHMKKLMYADRTEAFEQEDKRNISWLEKSIIPAYKTIADSCLGIIDGDHFMVFANGMTSGQYIAKRLKVPYLGERSAFVDMTFSAHNAHMQYIIHARHGRSCPGTHGGDINSLVKQESSYLADLHLGGHTHKENCHPERLEYVSLQGAIKSKIVWYMRGGSFLDGFPNAGKKTYAYRREYNPLPCGWGEVELHFARAYRGNGKSKLFTIKMTRASIVAA